MCRSVSTAHSIICLLRCNATHGRIPVCHKCSLDVTSISCRSLLICVNNGTTYEQRLTQLFPARFVVIQESGIAGMISGACNAIAGGAVDVATSTVQAAGYTGPYQTGNNRYSEDPLALVTRQDDVQWSSFVFWIVSAIFYAEEQGINSTTAFQGMPVVNLFGPTYANMFRDAVEAVG